ncbi:MAG: hypothetical protein QNJ53_13960 [Pleurocapsa sp. MO_192.B19]|nr:hypothetical protein [Pleurocapsa sp. MO_192.B19]
MSSTSLVLWTCSATAIAPQLTEDGVWQDSTTLYVQAYNSNIH